MPKITVDITLEQKKWIDAKVKRGIISQNTIVRVGIEYQMQIEESFKTITKLPF